MTQLKTIQTAEIHDQMKEILQSFIDQNRDILLEIGSGHGDKDGLQRLCLGGEEYDRQEQINLLLEELTSFSAQPEMEAKPL